MPCHLLVDAVVSILRFLRKPVIDFVSDRSDYVMMYWVQSPHPFGYAL